MELDLRRWRGNDSAARSSQRLQSLAANIQEVFLLQPSELDPTGHRVVDPQAARRIHARMMTCGHCDASGDFAFRVGLPGKSGVGGGILAIAPRRASVAVWAPGLNEAGNSLVGALALESLSRRAGWSVF